MKISLVLAAALSLAVFAGSAAAQDNYPPPSSEDMNGQDIGGTGQQDDGVVQPVPPEDVEPVPSAPPEETAPGTGGTGETMPPEETAPGVDQDQGAMQQAPPEATEQPATVVIVDTEQEGREQKAVTQGLSIAALGGVEGYTGSLAPNIDPGGAWGVLLTAQPTPVFGIELGYNGAVNQVSDPVAPDADVVRNGGNVDLKVGLPTPIEPYLFAGIGISYANVRDAPEISGYDDDTFGQVPLGAGLNFHFGALTAGARFSYNVLFDQDFTRETRDNSFGIDDKESGDLWDGRLMVGAKF